MRTYTSSKFVSETPCVTALGCFDGVHSGHAELILEAKRIAQKLSLTSAVWSFSEPPKNFFSPKSIPILTTPAEKRLAIQRLGIDILVNVPFDKNIAYLSPEDFFLEFLVRNMHSKHIVCGFNYRFGKGGLGDTTVLEKLCLKYGIGLTIIPPVSVEGITVSSSEIRATLEKGQISLSNRLLGHPYSIRAKIISGKHIGTSLGFPTINQSFEKGKAVPMYGVYLSRITIGSRSRYGITNIGLQPTVDGKILRAETNIFDFEGDLYGRTATVEFLEFLRKEKTFLDIKALTEQIQYDIKKAKEILLQRNY